MKKFYCFLFLTCLIVGCGNNKGGDSASAGNLNEEIEEVYDFFVSMHTTSPKNAAESWCDKHSSWNSESNGRDGYCVTTENSRAFVRMIIMKHSFYLASVGGSSHDAVCQTLRDLFGEPYRTETLHDAEYSEWKTSKGVEVAVEKDGILSSIAFASR